MVILQPNTLTNQDFLDKEWGYVDQTTGTMYVTYTRFTPLGETPLELMRCKGCAYLATITTANWDGPYTIVPNELDTFNQATMLVTTPSGRVVVAWYSRKFSLITGNDVDASIQTGYSDTDGTSFTGRTTVLHVNPQGEPPGYNRGDDQIFNPPYLNVNKGTDDEIVTASDAATPGYGNLYVTYFNGKTPVATPPFASAADILVSTSNDGATTWGPPVKNNDDPGNTSHVFPSVQVNKNGYVYVTWLDRRNDPSNVLTDAWANVSKDNGVTFGPDRLQTDVATSWFGRSDAAPNYGDYN